MVPPESSGGQGVGFVFEAQREESPGVGRRRLESLPTHEDRIRRQPRETVPHDHERLFAGFMEWREVSYFTLQVLYLNSWLYKWLLCGDVDACDLRCRAALCHARSCGHDQVIANAFCELPALHVCHVSCAQAF
jgi:hypothetical protein